VNDYERGYADGIERGRRVVADPERFPIPAPDYTMRTAHGHPPIPVQYRKVEPPVEEEPVEHVRVSGWPYRPTMPERRY
jgi:hypothetical protein